ncbi:hypothetical protein M405DRAFT_817865, partial [Rhizopogon salebrosus TDB-379]
YTQQSTNNPSFHNGKFQSQQPSLHNQESSLRSNQPESFSSSSSTRLTAIWIARTHARNGSALALALDVLWLIFVPTHFCSHQLLAYSRF